MTRQFLLATSMMAVFAGCSKSRDDYAPLGEFVANADQVTLYEGLPHQYAEAELLEQELARTRTFTFGEFAFYVEPMPLSQEDAAALTAIFDAEDAFSDDPPGRSKCGPYHPDYAVEWTKDDTVVRVQLCFGCKESKVYSGDSELYLSLADDAEKKLKPLSKDRWQSRPKTKLAKM